MADCPSCGTEMRPSFRGEALAYYVCGSCGMSKMEVRSKSNGQPQEAPSRPTGLVCPQCNKPYATIARESAETFDLRCLRCGHQWTVATSENTSRPDVH
jgi:transposase-like protein